MRARWALFAAILLFPFGGPVLGHEFWIEPTDYMIDSDRTIEARLKVGQSFEGSVLRFFPNMITRFEIYRGGDVAVVKARLGDDPALSMPPMGDGLLVAVHETTDNILTYTEWQTFTGFVTHKGYPDLIDQHQARGLPKAQFRESYRRFAKSLIAAGRGAGQDHRVGLRTEIVALANPYTDDISDGLPIQVWFEDKPRAGAQIEVFRREGGEEVFTEFLKTDADGKVTIPAFAGAEYLVDAVVIQPLANDDPEAGPVWESLWASLTYRIP